MDGDIEVVFVVAVLPFKVEAVGGGNLLHMMTVSLSLKVEIQLTFRNTIVFLLLCPSSSSSRLVDGS